MVLGTLCPLIIPFLALSSISGIHPVGERASSTVGVVVMQLTDGDGSGRRYASLFRGGPEVTSIG